MSEIDPSLHDIDIQTYWNEHYNRVGGDHDIARRQGAYICLPDNQTPPDYGMEVIEAAEHAGLKPDATVADVGCSVPDFLETFQLLNHRGFLVGVEPNLTPAYVYDRFELVETAEFKPDNLKWYEQSYQFVEGSKRRGKGISLRQGDASHIPMPSKSVDLITYKFSPYQIPQSEQPQAIQESKRVLKQGGYACWITSGEENKQMLYGVGTKTARFLGSVLGKTIMAPPQIQAPFTSEKALMVLAEHYRHVYVKFFNQQLIFDRPLYRDLAFEAVWTLRDRYVDEQGKAVNEDLLFDAIYLFLVDPIERGIASGDFVTDKMRRTIIFTSDTPLDLPMGPDDYKYLHGRTRTD